MNFERMGKWAVGLVLIALLVCLGTCSVILTCHLLPVIDSYNAAGTLKKANAALDSANSTLTAINAPCKGFHGSTTCGVLAQASQTEKNIGILAGQSALQVKLSSTLVNSAAQSIQSAAGDVHTVAVGATQLTSTASDTLRTTQTTIQGLQPLEASLTRTSDSATEAVNRFNALLDNPAIYANLQNSAEVTKNLAGVTADLHAETTKLFNPAPCATKGCKVGRVFSRVGGYLSLAAAGVDVTHGFYPLKVSVQK